MRRAGSSSSAARADAVAKFQRFAATGLLGGQDLADLRKRLRRHFERVQLDAPPTTIRLAEVSPREYEVLASLMGRPTRNASSTQVNIAAVDAALRRAGIASSLKAALELLDGQITHVPTAR